MLGEEHGEIDRLISYGSSWIGWKYTILRVIGSDFCEGFVAKYQNPEPAKLRTGVNGSEISNFVNDCLALAPVNSVS